MLAVKVWWARTGLDGVTDGQGMGMKGTPADGHDPYRYRHPFYLIMYYRVTHQPICIGNMGQHETTFFQIQG